MKQTSTAHASPYELLIVTLRGQKVILDMYLAKLSSKYGGRRYRPYAFTEHRAIMAATVLNSPRAVKMSVFVVRAFVHFRRLVVNNSALAAKLYELESRLETHDRTIGELVAAIRELIIPKPNSGKPIGFQPLPEKAGSPVQKSRLRLLH